MATCSLELVACGYLKSRNISNPSAYTINASSSIIPTTCAYSMNLSVGLRPVTISYKVNSTWPPSNAGIGRIFMKANIMLRRAVIDQNRSQSHRAPNILPMDIKLPNDSLALTSFDVKINFRFVTFMTSVFQPLLTPAGNDLQKLYSF